MFKTNKEREAFIIGHMPNITYHQSTDTYIMTSVGMWDEYQYFGKLWKWAKAQGWWGYFVRDVIGEDSGFLGPLYYPISQNFIEAEGLANAIYKYLKELQGVK